MLTVIRNKKEAVAIIQKLLRSGKIPAFFLGAGASRCQGFPLLSDLTQSIREEISISSGRVLDYIAHRVSQPLNVEQMLTILLACERIGSCCEKRLNTAIIEIKERIFNHFCRVPTEHFHYEFFKGVSANMRWTGPVDIFTTNYDVAIEAALDRLGAPYTTGLVGVFRRHWFGVDLLNSLLFGKSREDRRATGLTAHLEFKVVKLHGSVTWRYGKNLHIEEITNLEGLVFDRKSVPIIYPSLEKAARFRHDLPYPELSNYFEHKISNTPMNLIFVGYSFGDEHLNRIIIKAAETNPRLSLWVFARDAAVVPKGIITARRHRVLSGRTVFTFEQLSQLVNELDLLRRRGPWRARFSDASAVEAIIGDWIKHHPNFGLRGRHSIAYGSRL